MFSKYIIISDLDGTLLDDDKNISEKNMRAIEYFCAHGGKFTVATGRGYGMARSVIEKLKIEIPVVIFNGAAVYDFRKSVFLWHSCLDMRAAENSRKLIERFPDIGIEILSGKEIFVPAMNKLIKEHMALENLTPTLCDIDTVSKDGWFKVLIAYPADKIQQVIDFAAEECADGVNWVHSFSTYHEMLPEGISKGAGFKKLLELTGLSDRVSVAAGDYGNDLDLICTADIGIAVANAQPQIKKAAKHIVCDNNHSAIYEIVKLIENGKI